MTQKKFADILGISRQAVSRWETEDAEPSDENLDRICSIFHLPKEYFFGAEFDSSYLDRSYLSLPGADEIAISEVNRGDGESTNGEAAVAASACETLQNPKKEGRALTVLTAVVGALLLASFFATLIIGIDIKSLYSYSMMIRNYSLEVFFFSFLILTAILFAGELVLLGFMIRKKRKNSANATQMTQEAIDL